MEGHCVIDDASDSDSASAYSVGSEQVGSEHRGRRSGRRDSQVAGWFGDGSNTPAVAGRQSFTQRSETAWTNAYGDIGNPWGGPQARLSRRIHPPQISKEELDGHDQDIGQKKHVGDAENGGEEGHGPPIPAKSALRMQKARESQITQYRDKELPPLPVPTIESTRGQGNISRSSQESTVRPAASQIRVTSPFETGWDPAWNRVSRERSRKDPVIPPQWFEKPYHEHSTEQGDHQDPLTPQSSPKPSSIGGAGEYLESVNKGLWTPSPCWKKHDTGLVREKPENAYREEKYPFSPNSEEPKNTYQVGSIVSSRASDASRAKRRYRAANDSGEEHIDNAYVAKPAESRIAHDLHPETQNKRASQTSTLDSDKDLPGSVLTRDPHPPPSRALRSNSYQWRLKSKLSLSPTRLRQAFHNNSTLTRLRLASPSFLRGPSPLSSRFGSSPSLVGGPSSPASRFQSASSSPRLRDGPGSTYTIQNPLPQIRETVHGEMGIRADLIKLQDTFEEAILKQRAEEAIERAAKEAAKAEEKVEKEAIKAKEKAEKETAKAKKKAQKEAQKKGHVRLTSKDDSAPIPGPSNFYAVTNHHGDPFPGAMEKAQPENGGEDGTPLLEKRNKAQGNPDKLWGTKGVLSRPVSRDTSTKEKESKMPSSFKELSFKDLRGRFAKKSLPLLRKPSYATFASQDAAPKPNSTLEILNNKVVVNHFLADLKKEPENTDKSKFAISLPRHLQMRLYSEVEYMLQDAVNTFLMGEVEAGRISVEAVANLSRAWQDLGRAGVVEFLYDVKQQLKFVEMNIDTIFVQGEKPGRFEINYLVKHNWKDLVRELSLRTFCAADVALKKMLQDCTMVLDRIGANRHYLYQVQRLQIQAQRSIDEAETCRQADEERHKNAGIPQQIMTSTPTLEGFESETLRARFER